MDGFVGQKGASSLLLQQVLILDKLRESDSVSVEVGVLGAHEHKVTALASRQVVPLAHHEGHVIELVDFERVQDQVHEVLIDVVHLDDEVGLVDGFILRIDRCLVQDSLLFQLIQLFAHVIGPQAEVEDDLLSDHVLHIGVVFLLINEVDLLNPLLISGGIRDD